jgi:hypothetical protein
MNDNNQLDRLINASMLFLESFNDTHSKQQVLNLFPKYWNLEKCNAVLDTLLEYCIQAENEFWEHAVVIRNVKEKINS